MPNHTFSETVRARALDSEVADWSSRGYQVLARTPLSAQLSKSKPSIIVPVALWLVICAGMWFAAFEHTMLTLLAMGGLWALGVLFLFVLRNSRRADLVYLTISADGGITQH